GERGACRTGCEQYGSTVRARRLQGRAHRHHYRRPGGTQPDCRAAPPGRAHLHCDAGDAGEDGVAAVSEAGYSLSSPYPRRIGKTHFHTMAKRTLPPEVVSLIHHVELNENGWWKKAVGQIVKGLLLKLG